MDWIEVTARTLDEAKELALDRLGVVEDELEWEVIDEPRSGLFRRSDARIRARVKPLSREKPADRRRRRRGSEHRSSSSSSRSTSQRSRSPKPASDDDDQEPTRAPASSGAPSSSGPNGSGGSRSRSRRRGGRGRGKSGAGNQREGATRTKTTTDVDDDAEAEVDVETMPVDQQAEHAAAFADELVRTMGFTASVRTQIDEDDIDVMVEGDNLGVLVGPRGVTLQALEEVVRAAVQRHAGGHSARVHVDVAGYRARRREALAAFARQVADEVKASGSARSLEAMGSSDRKVVHDALTEVEGVSTVSEGEDPRRRVVIVPE
jgi:spoIIIJ-associated protein